MRLTAPFIHRPIAIVLLMAGMLLGGLVTLCLLPVAAQPNVNIPTILMTAQLPGQLNGKAAQDANLQSSVEQIP